MPSRMAPQSGSERGSDSGEADDDSGDDAEVCPVRGSRS